jgi:hypothetical protein
MKSLQRAVSIPPKWTQWSAAVMKSTGLSLEQVQNLYHDEFLAGETWMNALYVVIKTQLKSGFTHLSIRRTDRAACRDWRDFQQIKNELCGKEREGVELYPAESRLVDTANQFHIWVLPEKFVVPIGYFFGRQVSGSVDPGDLYPGAVQRPFESGGPGA